MGCDGLSAAGETRPDSAAPLQMLSELLQPEGRPGDAVDRRDARYGLGGSLLGPSPPASAIVANDQPAEPTAEPIITATRLREIRSRAMLRPEPIAFDEEVAVALGLTQAAFPYLTKQASYGTREPMDAHYFAVRFGGLGNDIVVHVAGPTTEVYVIDDAGRLINVAFMTGGQLRIVPLDEARPAFEAEMRRWATVARFSPAPSGVAPATRRP